MSRKRLIEVKLSNKVIVHEKEVEAPFYPVCWIVGEFGKTPTYYGVCGYSKKVFTLNTDFRYPLIINDLIVENGKCEEAERCINLECSLNKTTFQKWAHGEIKPTPARIESWRKNCKMLANIGLRVKL